MSVDAVDYICNRIINSDDFDLSYQKLFITISKNRFNEEPSNPITIKEYKRLLKYSDFLSNSKSSFHRSLALKLISSLHELYYYEKNCQLVVKSVLSKFGLFSAEEKFIDNTIGLPVSVELSNSYRKLNQKIESTEDVFTNAQFEIYQSILNNMHFSFSGPTSLGKSFLLKNTAIDLTKNVNNIVFILPTKALLEEYLIDIRSLLSKRNINSINVTKSVSGYAKNEKNILIFTQERYNNFLFEKTLSDEKIDVLFIDEAHKLAEKRSKRSITLYKVIRKTIDDFPNVKLIFSSPVISNPEMFFKTFDITQNSNSLVVKESPVTQNLYFSDIGSDHFRYFDNITKDSFSFDPDKKYANSFDLISSIGQTSHSNLIYISSKIECIKKCGQFIDYLAERGLLKETDDEELSKASVLIGDFIHKEFTLAKYLKYGIALHNGSLPNFIRKIIEDLYSRKKIKYIFCTSTLLEGVNLPTKNVFIYPFNKSTVKNELKCNLDFWNLAGRAGRYKNELSGNIICIGETDGNWDLIERRAKSSNTIDIDDGFTSLLSKHLKIINYLSGKTKDPDKNIVDISTLILAEVMNHQIDGKIGSLLNSFKPQVRSKIIEASIEHLKRKKISEIDPVTFASTHNFDSDQQARAFAFARNPRNILRSFSKEDVSDYIRIINNIYRIRKTEDSVKQLVNVVYAWLMGTPLSLIVANGIKFGKSVRDPESYEWVSFDENNPVHLNQKIIETISCIENEVTFTLESCCSHFYQLTKAIHGEKLSGCNLAPSLEYGTMDSKQIELQDFGFSRVAASEIVKKHRDCVIFSTKTSKLKVNLEKLRTHASKDSIIRKEISWLS
ncbi:DEAD/DEAH box helicase family protein [Shewanella algae]|uniref:DEAD/DEAH box helicase family protein n=1 Tax=Shewanella algae TaxID=38313 RepID=UPI003AACA49A